MANKGENNRIINETRFSAKKSLWKDPEMKVWAKPEIQEMMIKGGSGPTSEDTVGSLS